MLSNWPSRSACLQDTEGGTIQCMLYSKKQKAAALECVQRGKESVCLFGDHDRSLLKSQRRALFRELDQVLGHPSILPAEQLYAWNLA